MVSRERVLAFRVRGHHLHRRVRSLGEAVAACGVRNTPPGSAAAALAARVADLPAGRVDEGLADGSLVEVIGPRLAPTVVLAADVAVFTAGVVPSGAESLRVALEDRAADALGDELTVAVGRTADVARELLGDGPTDRGALSTAVTKALPRSYAAPCTRCAATHVHDTLFRAAGAAGAYAIAPRTGRTVSVVRLDLPPADGAREELVRRFLRCHGPATPADFAAWALLGTADAAERFAALGDEIAEVDGRSVLAADESRLRRATPPRGVRLLPPNDPFLASRDRATLVPDAARRKEIWPALSGPGAVLADGEIAGTWRAQRKGRVLAVQVTPFGPLPALDAEAERLAPHRGCDAATVTIG